MKYQPEASHFINGAYLDDTSGKPIEVIYPGSGKVIATLHSATHTIVEEALRGGDAAKVIWREATSAERSRVLSAASRILRERAAELAELETQNTGKPIQETIVADAGAAADLLEYFGSVAASITGDYIPLANGDFAYTVPEPVGLCVGIGAWNYPLQIACAKAAPALACGNTVIFKPSEITPLTALKLAEVLHQAGLPPGVFNVVQGYGEVGATLIADPRVAKVSLTGSVATGKRVYAAAAEGMKRVTMELGGKSPLIVFDDADLETAVSGAILGNFYSSGQVCSNGTRVFVQKGIKTAFTERLLQRLSLAKIGDPMDPETNFGPLISERQLQIVRSYIEKGIGEGANLVHGGIQLNRAGYYLYPTVFTEVDDRMTIAREEIFGPVMSVLDFDTEEEVIGRANATEFGLAAGVFTANLARAHRVAKAFESGTCYINTYNVSPPETPFGGSKLSGVGRENSKAAIQHYTEMKTVLVSVNELSAPY
ncbi:betaine-aldehyde dehydrogenase [Mesorhizobium robiniae]|uniref:Betaine-aldehyde dehydrogenase n=1 Tax=Mesorhizobium robiniae TaxID=559315 RepID=A0ABV2GYR7_9HYPH|nr:betaine-aldehyde dehydrogenase [Mesorhizobium sp. ZC-5]MCV3243957.1 betaine-aldehyde dehydrogenase [Mesorhizobium sp. ZC-5]